MVTQRAVQHSTNGLFLVDTLHLFLPQDPDLLLQAIAKRRGALVAAGPRGRGISRHDADGRIRHETFSDF